MFGDSNSGAFCFRSARCRTSDVNYIFESQESGTFFRVHEVLFVLLLSNSFWFLLFFNVVFLSGNVFYTDFRSNSVAWYLDFFIRFVF